MAKPKTYPNATAAASSIVIRNIYIGSEWSLPRSAAADHVTFASAVANGQDAALEEPELVIGGYLAHLIFSQHPPIFELAEAELGSAFGVGEYTCPHLLSFEIPCGNLPIRVQDLAVHILA
ncbi:MAG: hypothetical protein KGJ13_01230 [Patescibacteria group bacterium]|nr:hypothetical protein [Patescibacteria group bacterium]